MSNCLLFALGRWWTHGGHVVTRKSHHGWWPHFIWSPDLRTFEEFLPLADGRRRMFPPPLFRGYVRQFTPHRADALTELAALDQEYKL